MEKPVYEDIALVEATTDDFEFFYSLKCEENSIYWGGFADKPGYMDLLKWYRHILSGKAKQILIVKWRGKKVGVISFKIYNGTVCDDYSTNISEKYSGMGIGTLAIKKNEEYLRANYPACKISNGFVRSDNLPSQNMLQKCGWALTEDYEDRFLASANKNKVIRFQKWVKKL